MICNKGLGNLYPKSLQPVYYVTVVDRGVQLHILYNGNIAPLRIVEIHQP